MKYIIVNSIKDANRYLRKQNKETKNTTSNTKCVHLVDFAKEVVVKDMAKKGCLKALDVLDGTSGAVLLQKLLRAYAGSDFFVPRESLSQETAAEVWKMLCQIRMGETTDAYVKTENKSVNQMKELIESYEMNLEARGLYDVAFLYKKAVEILKTGDITGGNETYVISDVCLQKLTAVEKEFLRLYTKENYTVFSLLDILKEKEAECLKDAEFFHAYGISNEVAYVISQILERKQKLGDVEIFYSSAEYEPFIEAQFSARGISYTMTNRQLPADNPYLHCMKYVLEWAKTDFAYEALKPVMLMSKEHKNMFFSEIRAGIGWGRERYRNYIQLVRDEAVEEEETKKKRQKARQGFCDCLEELLSVFETKDGTFILYENVFWRLVGAVRSILGEKDSYKYFAGACKAASQQMRCLGTSKDMNEIIQTLSEEVKKITYSDEETPSAVEIRKIDNNVHILERKHIYVLGMSNAHFTGSIVESPVLSDEDLALFLDSESGYVDLRKNQEEQKKQALRMTLATRGEGTLSISYPSYDTVNLRELTPAVPFIRILQDAGVQESDLAYAGYENIVRTDICYSEESIWKEADAAEVEPEEKEEKPAAEEAEETEIYEVDSPIKKWSATSLQQLLSCPRQFYYQRLLHLPDESYKMPQADRWLAANEKGTLAHEIMENYCNEVFLNKTADEIPVMIQEDMLAEIMDEAIARMLKVCPYMSKAAYEIECELIRKNCRIYLEKMHKEFSDPANKWVVIACEAEFEDVVFRFMEEDVYADLHFTAKMDRLDAYVDEDGTTHYRIVDYKSGGQKKHLEKIESHESVQHIVYKLALETAKAEQENLVVDEVCFLHFFEEDVKQQEILCTGSQIADFMPDVKEFVINVLKKNTFDTHGITYGIKEEEMRCNYCSYKDICRAKVRGE